MQNVTVQFQKYLPLQRHPCSVPFSCCQITRQRKQSFNIGLRGRRRHKIQCHLRQVSCSWTCAPTRTVLCLKWCSVLELCRVTLQFRFSIGFVNKSLQRCANTGAGITSAGTYIINWYVPANATQFVVRRVAWYRVSSWTVSSWTGLGIGLGLGSGLGSGRG